jgi:cytoskeletal protein CcmA (bactofilin family)
MWKTDKRSDQTIAGNPSLMAPVSHESAKGNSRSAVTPANDVAHIGKSVVLKGEVSGSENLYVDGEVEGTIELRGSLTIGPHGRVRADIRARDVIIRGKLEGNITDCERAELKQGAVVAGDIRTSRIVIDDGAQFAGKISTSREGKAEISEPVTSTGASVAAGAVGPGQSAHIGRKPQAVAASRCRIQNWELWPRVFLDAFFEAGRCPA